MAYKKNKFDRRRRKSMTKVQRRKMNKNCPKKVTTGLKDSLSNARFDVEHALSLYATSFVYLPARLIYQEAQLKKYEEIIKNCHIYIIGYLPKLNFLSAIQVGHDAILEYQIGSDKFEFALPLPSGCNLEVNGDYVYAANDKGEKFEIPEQTINHFLQQHSLFEVQYVGQAYGRDGSRNALDRLLKHETLQKISLTAIPEGKEIQLLLLEVEPNVQLITLLNPFAQNKDDSGERISSGLDKLFNTSEPERISLYEAALIRYFSPYFNKEFKGSFPSTRLKVLQDCYEKDFTMLVAEISFDKLPFQLCSDLIQPKRSHMAKYSLHEGLERQAFFYGEN